MCIDGDGYGDTQELANLIPDALNYEFFNYWRLSYSYQYKVGYDAGECLYFVSLRSSPLLNDRCSV